MLNLIHYVGKDDIGSELRITGANDLLLRSSNLSANRQASEGPRRRVRASSGRNGGASVLGFAVAGSHGHYLLPGRSWVGLSLWSLLFDRASIGDTAATCVADGPATYQESFRNNL